MAPKGHDQYAGRRLWLARVKDRGMVDKAEQVQTYMIAAPDQMAAEIRLRNYGYPMSAEILELGELVDDIYRVWDQNGQPFEGTLVAASGDTDQPEESEEPDA